MRLEGVPREDEASRSWGGGVGWVGEWGEEERERQREKGTGREMGAVVGGSGER